MNEDQQQKQALARAAALHPPIPVVAAERAANTLAGLDAVFQKAVGQIPAEELMWDGPDVGPGRAEEITETSREAAEESFRGSGRG